VDPRFLLDPVAFDVVWEARFAGLPTPAALCVPSAGRSHRERRSLTAAAWQDLAGRAPAGTVVDGTVAAGSELARLLDLLAHPAQRLELRGRDLRAIAAGRDGAGVLAVRSLDAVRLAGCDSLPLALLGSLPAQAAGPGPACSVPTAVLADALAAPALLPALLAAVPAASARMLDRTLGPDGRPRQVVAFRPDHRGELRRAGGVLTIVDGPSGRYLVTRSRGGDATEWCTAAPADPRRLRQRLTELLHPHPALRP
jgi:hypothetical protein